MTRSLLCGLCLWMALPALAAEATGHYAERADGQALLERLSKDDGVDVAAARKLLADARYQPDIVAAMRKPAEKTLTWADYRPIFVKPERAKLGAAYIAGHQAVFDRVEADYGVPANIVAAIIGVETKYGGFVGRHRVLDALATLAFDYPERGDYFTRELENFLRLCVEEDLACDSEVGSYAGAMGLPQFMPSSYRAYAVDGNHDGSRDLWEQPADIIASVANYLAEHHWRAGERVTVPAWLAAHANPADIQRSTRESAYRWDALRRLGVRTDNPPADDTRVGLLEFKGADGTEYWLGLHNFFVITTYNHSPLYAMAVYQLGQEIAKQRAAQRADNGA